MVSSFSRLESTFDFSSQDNSLPPQEIEAEEKILGGILNDPSAIGRISDKLEPEHFYISAHKEIYQICLELAKKQQPTDLLTVTSYLTRQGLLERIGGRNKLADLVYRTVSAINIDHHAQLVIDSAFRRQLIKFSSYTRKLGHATEIEVSEAMSLFKENSTSLHELFSFQSKEDRETLEYNKMIEAIRQIELECLDPGKRLFKMSKLSKKLGQSIKDLENIYFKSLIHSENEGLISMQEIIELYGNEIRQWLIHGFLPKGTTVLLHAKGGTGKTRLSYDFFYHLATGTHWQGFPVTKKSRCLVIQTDESPNDMLSALEDRGFTDDMDIRYKTKWTTDHIQHLRQEIEEFRPDIVLIDSLTSVSRHSTFTENDTEYARPILLLRDIAQEFGCTILIIHHSNSNGESRGTKAIFNSVSEVWSLKRDDQNNADGLERLLTIEKSRSRAPAAYRLRFEPEDKSWTCLGRTDEDPASPNATIKDAIVQFLLDNRGTPFEAEEIAHAMGDNLNTVRKLCFQLVQDGIITRLKPKALGRGYSNLYLIEGETSDTSDTPKNQYRITSLNANTVVSAESDKSDPSATNIRDHFFSPVEARVTGESDPIPLKNALINESEISSKKSQILDFEDHLSPEPLPDIEKKVILISDPQSDPEVIQAIDPLRGQTPGSLKKGSDPSPTQAEPPEPQIKGELPLTDVSISLRFGDEVEVVAGQHRGQTLIISSIDGTGIWLRKQSKGFAPPMANNGQPYQPHQLRKVQ
ncbi:AAA family ATPase [Halotia branconii]|uniref:DnaB-like helicase N-terminal domain-containing protein n=1 Tax=Halotia branconii CENA392 TaxID=1539056 RepID=A0AAJ6P9Q9_9CYAN|nr:DnaB-like helicase N-terminal domain-containing protein [Halotia branconii]WGV25991.1 DnaB-like helicase N-terminal domain-containing protein [Halotia branconii CENA392]